MHMASLVFHLYLIEVFLVSNHKSSLVQTVSNIYVVSQQIPALQSYFPYPTSFMHQ